MASKPLSKQQPKVPLPEDLPLPDPSTLEFCTQVQIRYLCGHSSGGEFIKCPQHLRSEDERCASKSIRHIDGRISSHKCRNCLRSA
ncbi:hypothetical protein N7541_008091 [Penicillium brevicompactum]|uniref:Uncharacterized protein n=1 Tax=Penicillium brevicompactum TaxID=5074 RepID=A0A9W9UN24_PENBR|nr:hypothetical protein N7541_008091 [Penicillium brevicompactum]